MIKWEHNVTEHAYVYYLIHDDKLVMPNVILVWFHETQRWKMFLDRTYREISADTAQAYLKDPETLYMETLL